MRGWGHHQPLWWLLRILIGVALAIALASWAGQQCSTPEWATLSRTNGDFGCFEFWVNRYQQLIGSGIAVAAALAAWLIGSRQLGIMRKQLLPDDHEVARTQIERLRTVSRNITKLRRMLDLLMHDASDLINYTVGDIDQVKSGFLQFDRDAVDDHIDDLFTHGFGGLREQVLTERLTRIADLVAIRQCVVSLRLAITRIRSANDEGVRNIRLALEKPNLAATIADMLNKGLAVSKSLDHFQGQLVLERSLIGDRLADIEREIAARS